MKKKPKPKLEYELFKDSDGRRAIVCDQLKPGKRVMTICSSCELHHPMLLAVSRDDRRGSWLTIGETYPCRGSEKANEAEARRIAGEKGLLFIPMLTDCTRILTKEQAVLETVRSM